MIKCNKKQFEVLIFIKFKLYGSFCNKAREQFLF